LVLKLNNYWKTTACSTKLNATDRRAWEAFENVCRNFIGSEKAEKYCDIMQESVSL
jgi:hypothetical protein